MAEKRGENAFAKTMAVAFREFRHTVLTKGFIFGALVLPVMLAMGFAAIGLLIDTKMAPVSGSVAVVDPSGAVADFVQEELSAESVQKKQARAKEKASSIVGSGPMSSAAAAAAELPTVNLKVESIADTAQEEALRRRVQEDGLVGLAIIPPEVLLADPKDAKGQPATFTLIVPSKSPPRLTSLLENSVAAAIVKARVKRAGNDYASLKSLLSVPDTAVRRLSADGTEARESVVAKTLLPMGFMMLLWVTTFTSGQYLLTSTIEEKSSKVMEVILSAVSPMQLLAGKIIGYALVSALMLGMYGGSAIAALSAASMGDLVSVQKILLLVVYFLMAYAFVAIMMASVGSAVNDLREAQSLVGPAMMILMVPLVLWMPISDQPNGMLATVMSFVPPAIPFVMVLRVTASSEPVAAWQIAASIVWGFACAFGFLWAGAKIFRVGVLMQGKPPTPRELLKWIRMA
ncbi:MAG: ABC transporter permease [Phycisphaerales bacterium]